MSCHAFCITQLLIHLQCALEILQCLRVVVLFLVHHPYVAEDRGHAALIRTLPIDVQCFAVILQCTSIVTKIHVHIPFAFVGHRYTERECGLFSLTPRLLGIVERSIMITKIIVLAAQHVQDVHLTGVFPLLGQFCEQ